MIQKNLYYYSYYYHVTESYHNNNVGNGQIYLKPIPKLEKELINFFLYIN